jgi:LuxR family maltose regulon positive regulatory protein
MVKAKCSFAEKRYEAVLKTLSLPRGQHSLGGFLLGRLEMTALKAVSFFKLGEKEKAFAALEDAWDMAASNSLDMPFVELGEDMRALAVAILAEADKGIPRPALESIRNKASIYAKKISVVVEHYRSRQKSFVLPVLSLQEREVLNGLAQGFTREDIAEDVDLSINAVKNVIAGLYTKLGALNRADAVRIAGSAGLIQTTPD